MNSALNYMLLQDAQDVDATIVVFPAWPCARSVSFKLAAAHSTTVDVVYTQGKLVSLVVTPAAAHSRVKFANCV